MNVPPIQGMQNNNTALSNNQPQTNSQAILAQNTNQATTSNQNKSYTNIFQNNNKSNPPPLPNSNLIFKPSNTSETNQNLQNVI